MSGLVKSSLQTVIVEGIYNDILTKNGQYYYFLGRTSPWTVEEGASPGEDGVWTVVNGVKSLTPPEPLSTFKYELDTRNNIITYKLVKPSDVAFVVPRHNWEIDTVYDMYDDAYSPTYPAYSGATKLEDAKFYVLTSLNNVYKCISNNYDSPSTVEPFGTGVDEFTTDDGYIWKFMYTIPVALQNKFYTFDYIPVMTSLRNRFYENGAITAVAVQDPGADYTNSVTLAVSGDGFLENNPYGVGDICVVSAGGAGYKPTKLVEGVTWTGGVATFTITGHPFVNGEAVTIRGVDPIGYNGNYTVSNVTTNTFDAAIAVTPGSYVTGGQVTVDILTFSEPLWGSNPTIAQGYCVINTSGTITNIWMDEQIVLGNTVYGYGYDQNGTVTIDTPFTEDFTWEANATYALNDIVKANANYYLVTTAGTVNTTMPIHEIGTVTFGTCALEFLGSDATAIMVLSKTEAIMLPIVEGGQITGVQIVDGGVGYTYCNVIPQDSPINESAVLTADIAVGNVDTAQADVELDAIGKVGAISYIKIAQDPITLDYKSGSGYGVDTVITITGDGTGAAAVPVIENGSITGIRITNHGTGYTREATVTIYPLHLDSEGNYIGAEARAILSPKGGHGSNAIHELYSNKVLFYSVLSDERLQGIPNLNDYRQFGVVKNPRTYGGSRLSSTSATPCWLITSYGTINITDFVKDDILSQGGEEQYKVIEIKENQMVIQAISQTTPSVASFYNLTSPRTGKELTCAALGAPQVDKFSGEILFIDNKLPFVVTVDQMITFRTTIGF